MLADAIKKPLNGEDGTSEDVNPEEGHEETYPHHDGSRLELTSEKATFRCLDSFTKSLRLNKEYLLAGSSIICTALL